jgi:predicted GH43/DUF377 family glycosyl hydrolase
MRVKLTRSLKNPVIKPRPEIEWEVRGTFNPGVAKNSEVIHILYRAVDEHNISSLGYANTIDGETILDRSVEPVFSRAEPSEQLGCEDPRITAFNGTFYVFYTAYSQRGPRIALASTADFKNYERYGVVGLDYDDKDCVLFPQRIGGKLAAFHRVEPDIEIGFFDDLQKLHMASQNPHPESYLERVRANVVMKPEKKWEEKKIGIGPPPIRTEAGWIVIYHGVDSNLVYRAGVALLDLENPRRVIARTPEPILEPEEDYEKVGVVPNVVFPTGVVVIKDELRVLRRSRPRLLCRECSNQITHRSPRKLQLISVLPESSISNRLLHWPAFNHYGSQLASYL